MKNGVLQVGGASKNEITQVGGDYKNSIIHASKIWEQLVKYSLIFAQGAC